MPESDIVFAISPAGASLNGTQTGLNAPTDLLQAGDNIYLASCSWQQGVTPN